MKQVSRVIFLKTSPSDPVAFTATDSSFLPIAAELGFRGLWEKLKEQCHHWIFQFQIFRRWWVERQQCTKFINFDIIVILDWIVFGTRGCLVHFKMVSGIPGPYALDASCTPPQLWNPKTSPDIFKYPRGAKSPLVENHWYGGTLTQR